MIIDCERCAARPAACGDCVVGVLLAGDAPARDDGPVPSGAPISSLDAPEQRALDVLADEGLVPRLRLVDVQPRRPRPDGRDPGTDRHAG